MTLLGKEKRMLCGRVAAQGMSAVLAFSLGLVAGCGSGEAPLALSCRCVEVRALTTGAGNDTEAAWSADGRRIAFQTDCNGDLDLAILEVASGKVVEVAEGEGHACYPAWTPDGGLVYAFGNHTGTAVQAANAKADCGYGLRLRNASGETNVLTQGYWRDYTPAVTADGSAVYYASTRDNTGNSASLWRLALVPGAATECVLHLDGGTVGAAQPSLSPDGRILLWAQLDSFRLNWRLCAAFATNLNASLFLTPSEMSAYAPRWSPDGRFIAFTGFREGDPAWSVYLLEPRSGALGRLETGVGNSRSPAWSPDGMELVFENNRSGFYKLYRTILQSGALPEVAPTAMPQAVNRVEARLTGTALAGADGTRVEGVRQSPSAWTFERPTGLDFGTKAFFVKVTLVVDKHEKETRIAVVGNYAEHALGWQVFVRENRKVCFNARDPKGNYVGVESDLPIVAGRPVRVLGIRDGDGSLRMVVDGKLQGARNAGATMAYGPALKVCVGQQWNGGMRLNGRVLDFACGRGYPAGVPRVMTRELLFGEVRP